MRLSKIRVNRIRGIKFAPFFFYTFCYIIYNIIFIIIKYLIIIINFNLNLKSNFKNLKSHIVYIPEYRILKKPLLKVLVQTLVLSTQMGGYLGGQDNEYLSVLW